MLRSKTRGPLSVPDCNWVRQIACGTWAYFEQYVTDDSHWLPPDNVQECPQQKVATRTSPTNEGLYLVSGLVAERLGFIGLHSLAELWEKNIGNWDTLEQVHGHHLNWYETSELRTLSPRYVSTVDSGNLLACYLTLSRGIGELLNRPILDERHVTGTMASLHWLTQQCAQSTATDAPEDGRPTTGRSASQQAEFRDALNALLRQRIAALSADLLTFAGVSTFVTDIALCAEDLRATVDSFARSATAPPSFRLPFQAGIVAARLESLSADVKILMPWLDAAVELEKTSGRELPAPFSPTMTLNDLADATHDASENALQRSKRIGAAAEQFALRTAAGSAAAVKLGRRFQRIADGRDAAASRMDFRFLYNPRRKLFSIGFNVDTGKLDRHHYDLLCSECRIASFLAIAKGDVDAEHWLHLGRPTSELNDQITLLSWGGSMFEFLMPQLFHRTYDGSLISTSCRTAIDQQIQHGNQRGVRWGISESAYSARARNSDYKYRSFGVPGLGLKRGLSKSLVVSPYSTALAMPLAPQQAIANLRALSDIALGHWGFYDAVDYAVPVARAPRGPEQRRYKMVRNYMAHHHGMSLLAFANVLEDDLIVRWFHSHPLVQKQESLLQEKTPASPG